MTVTCFDAVIERLRFKKCEWFHTYYWTDYI